MTLIKDKSIEGALPRNLGMQAALELDFEGNPKPLAETLLAYQRVETWGKIGDALEEITGGANLVGLSMRIAVLGALLAECANK